MPSRLLDVEDLIELVTHGRVAGAAGGDVVGCVALCGVAGGVVRRRGGRGWGRTRKVCGRGSHTEAGGGTDVVEHADSASSEALAIRQAGDVRTGVSKLVVEGGQCGGVSGGALVGKAALLPGVGLAGGGCRLFCAHAVGIGRAPAPGLYLPGACGSDGGAQQGSGDVGVDHRYALHQHHHMARMIGFMSVLPATADFS